MFLTFHYGNFFFHQAIEGVDEAVDLVFKIGYVGFGVGILGGQNLIDAGDDGCLLFRGYIRNGELLPVVRAEVQP
jgi:hypothetical protein